MFFREAKKVTKYFGYFWKKICHLGLSKIDQSGHTVLRLPFQFIFQNSRKSKKRRFLCKKFEIFDASKDGPKKLLHPFFILVISIIEAQDQVALTFLH